MIVKSETPRHQCVLLHSRVPWSLMHGNQTELIKIKTRLAFEIFVSCGWRKHCVIPLFIYKPSPGLIGSHLITIFKDTFNKMLHHLNTEGFVPIWTKIVDYTIFHPIHINHVIMFINVTTTLYRKTFCNILVFKGDLSPVYGMNNYVLIWGDWLSCDPLGGSHDSQSPHIRTHVCPILWQLWFICHKFIHTI